MSEQKNKLSQADVEVIFDCLENRRLPPPHLAFSIIPSYEGGEEKSPPPYEYTDGVYVLLRPILTTKSKKKKKSKTMPQHTAAPAAPEHLQHLIMPGNALPKQACLWHVSGPQFKTETKLQQRYCYPSGRSEYCSTKGSSLWTKWDSSKPKKHADQLEYRIMCVYTSHKRGNKKRAAPKATGSCSSSSNKKRRQQVQNRRQPPLQTTTYSPASPTVTQSPFRTLPLYVSPLSILGTQPLAGPCWPSEDAGADESDLYEPIRWSQLLSNNSTPNNYTSNSSEQQHDCGGDMPMVTIETAELPDDSSNSSCGESLSDESMDFPEHVDDFWNTDMVHAPSSSWKAAALPDAKALDHPQEQQSYSQPPTLVSLGAHDFAAKLKTIQCSIRDVILTAPSDRQSTMVHSAVAWAHQLASDPLLFVDEFNCDDKNDEIHASAWSTGSVDLEEDERDEIADDRSVASACKLVQV